MGEGSITFTYKAPDTEDNPGNADDKIYVYNSCDIKHSPMSSTKFRDKIAERAIKMIKADAEATLKAKCHSEDSYTSITWEFTFNVTSQYHDTIGDEETFNENYDVKSYSLSDVSATVIDKTDGSKLETHQGEINDIHLPESMWIVFDSKTGKAKEVNLPFLAFDLIFTGGTMMLQSFGTFPGMNDVKAGDGVHTLSGGGSYSNPNYGVTFSCKWSVQRHRRQ